MKLITRDTDYAVRAIAFIAESEKEMVPTDELVKRLKMPRPFLRKILQILNKGGVLKSYKGKGGGFSLTSSPKKLFLLDIMKAFQGDIRLNECIFKKRICPNIKACPLRKKITRIEDNVLKELKNITIASLIH
ncbi:MAG: Rrf2 family transcriptional regulator [Candidatus Orphnella occulta]|nr:Rrf2 family transcriptional regulator [Candidatus Orphnella occulta]